MGCRDYRGLTWHCHAAALNCTTAPHSEEVHFLTTTLDDPLARPADRSWTPPANLAAPSPSPSLVRFHSAPAAPSSSSDGHRLRIVDRPSGEHFH